LKILVGAAPRFFALFVLLTIPVITVDTSISICQKVTCGQTPAVLCTCLGLAAISVAENFATTPNLGASTREFASFGLLTVGIGLRHTLVAQKATAAIPFFGTSIVLLAFAVGDTVPLRNGLA